jgi:hypothetical protein
MSTAVTVRRDMAPTVREDADFFAIMDMGEHLVKTGFLPEHIKNGAQAAAIVLAGRELGMQTMRALRSLVLVKGKVQEMADSQLSRFKADGGRAVFKELTQERAVLWLRHPNGDEHEEVFTMADATKAGIKNHMYDRHPKPMLRSRAITAGLKSIGWEGGVGMYDPDEDIDDVPRPTAADPAPLPPRQPLANALTIPGAKTKWGGYGGKPLDECPTSVLTRFAEWVREDESRSKYALTAAAADEIVLRRLGAEVTEALAAAPDVEAAA